MPLLALRIISGKPLNIVKAISLSAYALACVFTSHSLHADSQWSSVTFDNDLFVDSDNGYTNGIYYSWLDITEKNEVDSGYLVDSLKWLLDDTHEPVFSINVSTVGQVMVTPDDIELSNPTLPPDDLPYAGMLFYSENLIHTFRSHADRIGVLIGVVGEYSFAEQTQKFIHKAIDVNEPRGWDTQLENEIVFQLGYGRIWKAWVNNQSNMDLLIGADAEIGTYSSSAGAGIMFRYGRELSRNFGSVMLLNSRTANPVASGSGWYFFTGFHTRYVFNQIFLDGNTFDDDESINYDNEQLRAIIGMAYSWDDISLTVAAADWYINGSGNGSTDDYMKFGTITLSWKSE